MKRFANIALSGLRTPAVFFFLGVAFTFLTSWLALLPPSARGRCVYALSNEGYLHLQSWLVSAARFDGGMTVGASIDGELPRWLADSEEKKKKPSESFIEAAEVATQWYTTVIGLADQPQRVPSWSWVRKPIDHFPFPGERIQPAQLHECATGWPALAVIGRAVTTPQIPAGTSLFGSSRWTDVYEGTFGSRAMDVSCHGSVMLRSASFGGVRGPNAGPLLLPLMPLWPGFAANTALHGGCLWLLVATVTKLRARYRRRRGLCPACAYDLRDQFTAGCSECGWGREPILTPASR